jgi:hypothetical protein
MNGLFKFSDRLWVSSGEFIHDIFQSKGPISVFNEVSAIESTRPTRWVSATAAAMVATEAECAAVAADIHDCLYVCIGRATFL